MDAEDTHDGGRNHRPCMDSFGVDQFQGIMEKYLIILGHSEGFGTTQLIRFFEILNSSMVQAEVLIVSPK